MFRMYGVLHGNKTRLAWERENRDGEVEGPHRDVGTGDRIKMCLWERGVHLGPPCCVFKSAPYIQDVDFLLPQMRLSLIDLHTVTLQPKVQATLHTRPSFHPEK